MTDHSGDIRGQLRARVRTAMKARQRALVAAYRGALAAIENAEAVAPDEYVSRAGALEASPIGVGAAEVNRRILTEDQIRDVVAAEAAERNDAAEHLTHDLAAAQAMREGADALIRLLESSD